MTISERLQNVVPDNRSQMACVLLQIAFAIPVRNLLLLDCEIYRMQTLRALDAGAVEAVATECVSIETLTAPGSGCLSDIAVGDDVYRALYNRTEGKRFIDLLSMNMVPCDCGGFSPYAECERCAVLQSLRQIGSGGRQLVLDRHELRAQAADKIRSERGNLITAALSLRDFECAREPAACKVAANVKKLFDDTGAVKAI